MGKYHGSVPGWYLVKENPEMLLDFAVFFSYVPPFPQNSNKWFDVLKNEGVQKYFAYDRYRLQKKTFGVIKL